jgi:hypothetical protein
MVDECYTYTIMPDFGNAPYGWMKRPGQYRCGVGPNMADSSGWSGDHPISKELDADFSAWSLEFECNVNSTGSGDRLFDWRNFHDRGLELARRLKAELGPQIKVRYEKPIEDPGEAVETVTEILANGTLKTVSGYPLEKIEDLDARRVPAFAWSEHYTREQRMKISAVQNCWSRLFLEPEDQGHYARLQLLPERNHLRHCEFKGIIDGKECTIHLVVWTLKLEAIRLIYKAALERASWRYPGWWEHIYVDGLDIGERRLRFISGTHNLAFTHLARAFKYLCEEGQVPDAVTRFEVMPCSRYGLPTDLAETEGKAIEPDHWLVRVVVDADEINDAAIFMLKEQLEQGRQLVIGDGSRSPVYEDIESSLIELNLQELALLNRRDARKPVTDIDRKLLDACEWLDREGMELALHQGADPNVIDESEVTVFSALSQALCFHDQYIEHPEHRKYDWRNLPTLSVEDKKKLMETLFHAPANRNLAGYDELAPIADAACCKQEELLKELFQCGADPSMHCYDEHRTDWPECWYYLDADSGLGDDSSFRMMEFLEQNGPTPYWEPCETEIAQQQKPISGTKHHYIGFLDEVSEEEGKFLNRSGMGGVAEAAIEYAKAFNLLDPELILHRLTEEAVVRDTSRSLHIKWRHNVSAFLHDDIATLATKTKVERIWAQLATDSRGRVVVLLHKWGETEPFVWVEIEADSRLGQITKIQTAYDRYMLKTMVKSGIYPGLDGVPWQLNGLDRAIEYHATHVRNFQTNQFSSRPEATLDPEKFHKNCRPSQKAQHYIDGATDRAKAILCYIYAFAYNTYATGLILNRVNHDVEYVSIDRTLEGKERYAHYLEHGKRRHRYSTGSDYYELGFSPVEGSPCVLVHEKESASAGGLGDVVCWIDIKPDEQGFYLAIRAIENEHSASLTGTSLFPGIEDVRIQYQLIHENNCVAVRADGACVYVFDKEGCYQDLTEYFCDIPEIADISIECEKWHAWYHELHQDIAAFPWNGFNRQGIELAERLYRAVRYNGFDVSYWKSSEEPGAKPFQKIPIPESM